MGTPVIDERHRKKLLGFLLVKTAAVRQGIKPGELLRVRHCYADVNSEGLRVCLYRSDIYDILGLFYNPAALDATLAEPHNRRWLAHLGYPSDGTTAELLAELVRRFSGCAMSHEVGIFIGYPLKDVAGFMHRIATTPSHGRAWRIYGNARESLARMRRYATAEEAAKAALQSADGIDDFIRRLSLKMAS